MVQPARAARAVEHSGVRTIVNRVSGNPDENVVRLEIGEPGFATLDHVVAAEGR